MNETVRLLDAWKRQHQVKTDADAARRLGVTRQAINNWRHRGSEADAGTLLRLCLDTGQDLAVVLHRLAGRPRPTLAVA